VLFSVRYELNNMQIYVLVRPSLIDTSSTNSSTPRTLVVASTNSRALFNHVRYEPTIYKRQPDRLFAIFALPQAVSDCNSRKWAFGRIYAVGGKGVMSLLKLATLEQ